MEVESADALLRTLARKYIWWKPPQDIRQERIVAQIMDIGDFGDVQKVEHILGTQVFVLALKHAEAGWFSPKSWAYWHQRCGLTPCDESPTPLPVRRLSG